VENPDGSDMPAKKAQLYYTQRSGAGLLINEGTIICPEGNGYAGCPGIYNKAQVEAWKPITAAVKAQGGHMCTQLWHVGRVSTNSLMPDGGKPFGPSAIAAKDTRCNVINDKGELVRAPCPEPRAMTLGEVRYTVQAYAKAAANAIVAGFDMVEVHGAHGYLVQQFMSTDANQRDDMYGGSVENRCRFALEVVDACIAAVGKDRVGFRHSPFVRHSDCEFSDMAENIYFIKELAKREIAFLHLSEPDFVGGKPLDDEFRTLVRELYKGVVVVAGAYTQEKAIDVVQKGFADAVAFGRFFISNPDLPERIRNNVPFAEFNPATFFYGGDSGYVDYPASPTHA